MASKQRPVGAHPVYWVDSRTLPPKEWSKRVIREISFNIKGKLPSRVLTEPTPNSMPYLLMDGLRGGKHVFTEDTNLPSVTPSDTLIIADGSQSGYAVRGVAGVLGSTLLGFYATEGVNASFLYHLLSSLFPLLASTTTGTAIPHLDQNLLSNLHLTIPPLDEQAVIARILDTVDAAIERTREAVERAKELRTSLIADLLSKGVEKNGCIRSRQDAPKEFTRTSVGWLPLDWEINTLEEQFAIQTGFTLNQDRQPRLNKRGYLRVANVRRDELDLEEIKELEAKDTEYIPRKLKVDDLLIVEGHANRMEIGRCARVTPEAAGLTFQNHLYRLRADKKVTPYFGCLWLNSEYAQRYWNAKCATSSGLNTINQRMLKRMIIPVPSVQEQEIISTIIRTQKKHITALIDKIDQLLKLKQSLMHDLLTGKVRVNNTDLNVILEEPR